MKERGILFSAPMVRALLDGSKTQTRRVVKLPVEYDAAWCGGWKIVHKAVTQTVELFNRLRGKPLGTDVAICPYGQPGDRLWVRETFMDLNGTGVEHRDDNGLRKRYAFAADSPPGSYSDEVRKDYGLKWKPSIHMPRAACRIVLEITSVRVERLDDISELDAKAEGVKPEKVRQIEVFGANKEERAAIYRDAAVRPYKKLWESLNGAGSWDANPWVWVVEFRRAEP